MTEEQIMAFKFNIAYNESRNRYDAMNKQSSASGKYQFIRSTAKGMWKQNKEMFQDLGISEADFSNTASYRRMMADPAKGPAIQERLMNAAIANYSHTLKRSGVPITMETLAAVHFMGPGVISTIKRQGMGFLSSGYNPTAGTGVANATIGAYTSTMRKMNTEAFRRAKESGSLLGKQSSDIMKGLQEATARIAVAGATGGAAGAVVEGAKVAAEAATGVAQKVLKATGLADFATSILPSFLTPDTTPKIQVNAESTVQKQKHSFSVPLIAMDGSILNAMCTINFESTTVTSASDQQLS
jgi:hypothetical protein